MLLELIPILLRHHPHLMRMVLSVPSKLNLFPNRLHPPLPPPQTQISEVNAVQSTSSQQSGGTKKTKNKSKNNNEQPKNQTPATEKKTQRKLKFPCIICGDDHYTRDFPHHNEVTKRF